MAESATAVPSQTGEADVSAKQSEIMKSKSDLSPSYSLENKKDILRPSQLMIKQILKGLGHHSLELTFPSIPPEKAVPMYFESVQNKRSMVDFPKYKEEINVTNCLARVRNERELTAMEVWLATCRELAVTRREIMDEQWESLHEKENELRTAFRKFNVFIRENEEKRDRSIRKLESLRELDEIRAIELKELKQKYDFANKAKDMMEKKLKEYSMYEDYLNETSNASKGEFRLAAELITRYEALLEAKALIKQKHEDHIKQLEEAVICMRRQEEDATLKLIGLRNYSGQLLERYEKAKFKSLKWESIVGLIDDYSIHTREDLVRTKAACWDIYTTLANRKEVDIEFEEGEINPQLIFIKKTMEELDFIMSILTKIRKKDDEI
ncbi:coiled-coil domain-containing protein 42-like [Onthophagus taurus]|uniref:coiled-coil domain-containing protein 42-like n=1 Tax=Onthophagus taurus TaxID=166361 RepID=UPI0039BE32E9